MKDEIYLDSLAFKLVLLKLNLTLNLFFFVCMFVCFSGD